MYILTNSVQDAFHIDITDCPADYIRDINLKRKNRKPVDLKNMKLVYYEKAGNILMAIKSRKNLEKWEDIWLKNLIDKCNPEWAELKNEFIAIESNNVLKYSNSAGKMNNKYS